MFEGALLCRKYAEFKNQSLKTSAGTQSCFVQRQTPGVTSSKVSLKYSKNMDKGIQE